MCYATLMICHTCSMVFYTENVLWFHVPHMWNACATCVPCYFTHETHIYSLQETWSTETWDVNLEYLCRVFLCVHACKSEVINERYCITKCNYIDFQSYKPVLSQFFASCILDQASWSHLKTIQVLVDIRPVNNTSIKAYHWIFGNGNDIHVNC